MFDSGRGVFERPSVDALGFVVVVAHATVASEYKSCFNVNKNVSIFKKIKYFALNMFLSQYKYIIICVNNK